MIVSFSGCDGAGKSTQINELVKSLEARGLTVKNVWSRGGYTPGFSTVKRSVLWMLGKNIKKPGKIGKLDESYSRRRNKILKRNIVARLWLAFAIIDIALLYGVYFRILSQLGIVVICDRYIADTKIDFEINFPKQFSEASLFWKIFVLVAPKPQISVVITVPTTVSLARSIQKEEPFPDSEQTLKFRLNCYKTRPEFFGTNILRIDGTNSVENCHKTIKRKVLSLYNT
jgi:thymidylate kinase